MKKTTAVFLITISLFLFSHIVAGQPKPATDSTQVDAGVVSMYEGLFGKQWSDKFAEEWNRSGDTAKGLGNMGKVYFVSISKETTSVMMEFDSLGKGKVLHTAKAFPSDTTVPIFSATLDRWSSFMEGKFNAITGVLTGRIKFKGSLAVGLKYGMAFNKVAPIGKRVSQRLYKK